jgi:capsular exopolysaccharide synthesis family protein
MPVALPGTVLPLPGADRPAGPPAVSAAPTATSLLHALRRRWLTALLVATVGAAGAVAVVLQVVPGQYTAVALLQVTSRSPAQGVLGENEPPPDPNVTKSNQEALIKSAPVLDAALNRDEAKALPAVRAQLSPTAWLAKAFKVEFKGAEVVALQASSEDAREAAVLVNAVADAYVEYTDKQDRARRKALLEQMEANQREAQKSLFENQRVLQRTLERLKIDDPETAKAKYDAVLRQLNEARKSARDLSLKEIESQGQIKSQKEELEALPRQGLPDAVVEKYLENDPVVRQYEVSLQKIDDEARSIRATLQDRAAEPSLEGLNQQRQQVLKQLAAYRKSKMPGLVKFAQAEGQANLGKMERALASLRESQTYLEGEVKRLEAEARRLTPGARAAADVQALQQDVKLKEVALEKLGDRIEALKLAPALGSRVTVVQRAEPPQLLDRSRQVKMAGGAGLGVFGFLLFGVALWEFRSRRISGTAEVVQGLGMSLVGTLPALPAPARRALSGPASKRDQYYQSRMTESVDAIRTLLLHSARTEDLQVVMVTSAAGGEGKTSLASQLAASLARAWRKTLLIDGDLRNPAVHKLFNQPLEPGFSEVLRGEVGVHDTVRPTAVSRLWAMSAGHWDSHAVQALAQEGVRSLFEQLKEQYDFIVVDSCPVLPVADSLLLGQHVDAVLFAVMRDVSRAPALYAAQQRLEGLGVRTLGAVMIGADGDVGATSYTYQAAPAR